MAFLDSKGLVYLWSKIKSALDEKTDKNESSQVIIRTWED